MADNNALLLQVSADVRSLEKQMAKAQGIVDKGSRAMERRAQSAGTNLDKFFGQGGRGASEFARAIGNVKTATLQQLAPGADRYATALGHLGVAGIAAGAAIAGVAAAFKGARQAAAFADDISDTANRLHVTTDALQEYRFAIRAAGGEEEGADQALEAFSTQLGLAHEGLKKAQRGFLALGFTKEQIKGFTDADTALKAVTERIAGLSSIEQDAVIKQLGLEGLKPLIAGGVTEMERLRAEAHKVGVVMDAELVKRGGELNDQFETVSRVIDIQMKSALVDLGPILLDLLKGMAELAKLAADVADAFKAIENRRTDTLLKNRESFQKRSNSLLGKIIPGLAEHDQDRAAQALAEIIKRTNGGSPKVGSSRSLIDTSKTGGGRGASGPRDDTEQRLEGLNQTLAGAIRDRLQAELGLTADIETRAETERRIAQEELAQALSRIAKQRADLADDKGFKGDRAAADAKLDLAETEIRKAAQAKVDLIAREADWAAEDRADETRKAIRDAELALLEAASAQAVTAAERTRIDAQILKIKQEEALHEAAKEISRDEQTGAISDAEGARRFGAFKAGQSADQATFDQEHLTPVQRYLASIQDLNTEMEDAGVRAFDSLSDGLASAILGAQSLGDVARNVFQQLAAEILSATIKQTIGQTIGSFLPGLAAGHADGGLIRGPGSGRSDSVPAMLSNGEFVVNARAASQNLALLSRINAGAGGAVPSTSIRHGDTALHISVYPTGTMSAADARRTGAQVGAATMRELARARKAGISG